MAGLTAADARAGVAIARPRLTTLTVDGVEHLLDPATPELLAAHRAAAEQVVLLPGFDEMVLGYADRSATVPVAYADRIVPGGNGMFRPTVIAGGRAIGTWRRTGRQRTPVAEPFDTFPESVLRQLPAAYAALPKPPLASWRIFVIPDGTGTPLAASAPAKEEPRCDD